MYLYSLPASSPEEFVSAVMSLQWDAGLDAGRGYVLSSRPLPEPFLPEGVEREAVQLCRGRPPLPVASYYPPRRGLPRADAATPALQGVLWLRPLGLFRKGREWLVATSCRTQPPLTGWERAPADAVYALLRHHASAFYWRYWPRGVRLDGRGYAAWLAAAELLARGRANPVAPLPPLAGVETDGRGRAKIRDVAALIEDVRGAVHIGEAVHMLVVGASAAGKTTFVKQLLRGQRFLIIDITPKGEYTDIAPVVEGSVDLSRFSTEERVQLLTIAFAATLGGQDRSFTEVQLGVLRRVEAPTIQQMILRLLSEGGVPQLTREVLLNKLAALCQSLDEDYRCVPHPAVSRDAPIQPPAVVRLSIQNDFLRAVVVHGLLMRLLKEPQPEPTLIVLDEYHRVASRVEGVEDPAEALIRMGRHGNWHVVVATQNPLDLKRSLLGIIPALVTFQLHGEAAAVVAQTLGVEPWVIESLGVGQWLARVRTRGAAQPRRWP